jgi:hypothetical protein
VIRRLAAVAGIALIVLAFAAGTRVSDTRAGLIAEVITLLAGGTGIALGMYAFFAREEMYRPGRATEQHQPVKAQSKSARDLTLGAGGIALSAVLVSGLALSGGLLWATLGLLLLLPMVGGSVYLFWRYLRANP